MIEKIIERNPVLAAFGAGASILNTSRHPEKTSEKYRETDDLAIVEALNDAGWFIKNYKQVKARSGGQVYKHFLSTFINDSFEPVKGSGTLSLLFSNAKDGTKPAEFSVGFFVFACLNGLKVGQNLFPSIVVRHKGTAKEQVEAVVENITQKVPMIYDRIAEMRGTVLNEAQALAFAAGAAALRFTADQKIDPVELLQARRNADNTFSLFDVLNRVQENIMRPDGLVKYASRPINKPDAQRSRKSPWRKARAVNNIAMDLQINDGLWQYAEQFIQ